MSIKHSNQSGMHRLLFIVSGVLLMAFGSANAQPVNDDIGGAIDLIKDVTVTVITTNGTTSQPLLRCNRPGPEGAEDGPDTWYTHTPEESGLASFATAGSDGDTVLGLYVKDDEGNLVEVACFDAGFADDLITEVEAGVKYYLKVGYFDGIGGTNQRVTVTDPPPPQQFIIESLRNNTSDPISWLVENGGDDEGESVDAALPEKFAEVPNQMAAEQSSSSGPSPGSQVRGKNMFRKGKGKRQTVRVKQVFDGQSNQDNGDVLGGFLAPPDTVGDVGTHYYVQMVNLLTEIFDKNGNSVLGPFPSNVFFTGLGGRCEFTNNGDPIVLYDEQTGRWLVSQFAFNSIFGPWSLCVAISTSGDPTGSYNQYEFDFTGIGLPDYPKWGFASDSVAVMANMFLPFQGSAMGTIDKQEMLDGVPATMVFFILGAFEFGHIPVDNDGPYFKKFPPTFVTNNGGSGDRIDFWEIHPDYHTPANTTLTEVAKIHVSPWDSQLCTASRGACIDQPGSGTGVPPDAPFPNNITFLEGITDRMMHRAQGRGYRSKGHYGYGWRHKKVDRYVVVNHTVDADGMGTAGIRGYIFKDDGYGWKLVEEGTFSPDGDHRWMGSVAMTRKGNFCGGWSISSQTRHPSIGIVGVDGRTGSVDNLQEVIVFDGNIAGNVQRQTARWGDYSSMNVDPVDDSCWYTQEHAMPIFPGFVTERFGWATKIIQFKVKSRRY